LDGVVEVKNNTVVSMLVLASFIKAVEVEVWAAGNIIKAVEEWDIINRIPILCIIKIL